MRSRVWVVVVTLSVGLIGAAPPVGAAGSPEPARPAVTADHIETFGGATHHGSLDTLSASGVPVADSSVVALVPTPSGAGYWVVMAEGSIYSFGDATFHGSLGSLRAAGVPVGDATVVAMAATPSGRGYWLADDRGGIFSFGDATFHGSFGSLRTAGVPVGDATVVALAATPSGRGYWLADDRGGIFSFGDARFHGSASGGSTEPVVAFAPVADGSGYRLLFADGRVSSMGAAPDHGSATVPAAGSALGIANGPGGGYRVITAQARADGTAPPLPPASGSGRRIVYSNSRQRVWLVEASGVTSSSWPVSGRRGVPAPGAYSVFSKSTSSVDASGTLVLRHMVRFAHGRTLAIGFHAIPTRNGRPIQSEGELGEYRSAGCVRQAPGDAARLYGWAPVGTPVIVTP